MAVLGLLIGALIGAALGHSFEAATGGALLGLLVGLLWRAQQSDRRNDAGVAQVDIRPGVAGVLPTFDERLRKLEQRVSELEASRGSRAESVVVREEPATPAGETMAPLTDVVAPGEGNQSGAEPVPPLAIPEPSSTRTGPASPPWVDTQVTSAAAARSAEPSAPPRYGAAAARATNRTADIAPAPVTRPETPRPTLNPLWQWFIGGNALTRIGVVVLFFGVAFLLRYFAEHFEFPIEAKLASVGLVGVALLFAGGLLRRRRPGYGLSLQGAGAGILYLTTFTALRLYGVLSTETAFALLVGIAGLTVWLAWRADSQPLAALAIAGAFLAPFLVATQPGSPRLLFGYFAVINAAIFALAWGKAWRALNALGFVFTFALGIFWGARYYSSAYFAAVEPFLILFFVFYLVIAILYARREGWRTRAPVDALLTFGVPLVSFALQVELVDDTRYGAAWSAAALAALYALLFAALRRRSEPGFALLRQAFLVLAIVFATIAIPFAVQARWTSAWWALEAAGVYWIGCRQRQPVARAFALVLEIAAAGAFILGTHRDADALLFFNPDYLGSLCIALAGLATCWLADHDDDVLTSAERSLRALWFLWSAAWWMGGGVMEVTRHLPRAQQYNDALAFIAISAAVALLLRKPLQWPRLAAMGAFVAPAMIVAGVNDLRIAHTTLASFGWLVWPLAWMAHAFTLRAYTPSDSDALRNPRSLMAIAHVLTPLALVAQMSWELSEWGGRSTAEGSVWIACAAALPAIAYLAVVARWRDTQRWPLSAYRESYTLHAGLAIATLLGVWLLGVNVMSPGDAPPLPYLPLANPLDITLLIALLALAYWLRRCGDADDRVAYGIPGLGLFVTLNGIVLRTGYHWLDLRWDTATLLASKPIQAALTLTWTATALPLMLWATRRAIRPLWMVGAALLAVVVAKLFLIDLASLSGLPRVIAFLGVGVLLLIIGYLAPLPPPSPIKEPGRA